MTTLPTPLLDEDTPTNAQHEMWDLRIVTPSSWDERLERHGRGTTPLTRLGTIGNVLVGAAASGSVLLAGVGVVQPAAATAITSSYRQTTEQGAPKPRERRIAEGKAEVESLAPVGTDDSTPLNMIEDLKRWLDLADEDVSTLAGVARRTLTNWRSGAAAYSSSTRRVATVHALVHRLVETVGPSNTRLWLNEEIEPGQNRLHALGDGEPGIARVLEDGASLIFARPTRTDFDSGLSDREAADATVAARRQVSPKSAPARRVRRPAAGGGA